MHFTLSRKVILASAIALASHVSFVQAAGYGINEQSAGYLATGFAGRASNAINASIASTNPAGISFVDGRQISAGADVILEGGEFTNGKHTLTPDAPTSTDGFQKTSFVPFGYFVMPFDDQWSFGFAGYAPYGIELDYDDNWAGKWFGDITSVQVMALQATASYKIREDLAIGFGLIGAHVKGKLTSRPGPSSAGMLGTIEGDDNTLAWNIGALWNVDEQTALGLAYHSTYKFNLKGDYTVSIAGNDLPSQDARLRIVMPEKVMLSATHKFDDQWTFMADVTWTRWTRFQEFHVTYTTGGTVSYVPMNWRDTWALSLGTSYQLNNQWQLRAGYMFDESPVTNATRTVRSPDANRNWFTFGANWTLSDNMNVDLAYAYVKLQDGTINEQKYDGPGQPSLGYGFITGNYSSGSHILGAQLNYKF